MKEKVVSSVSCYKKTQNQKEAGAKFKPFDKESNAFFASLPFEHTDAQKKCISEIIIVL